MGRPKRELRVLCIPPAVLCKRRQVGSSRNLVVAMHCFAIFQKIFEIKLHFNDQPYRFCCERAVCDQFQGSLPQVRGNGRVCMLCGSLKNGDVSKTVTQFSTAPAGCRLARTRWRGMHPERTKPIQAVRAGHLHTPERSLHTHQNALYTHQRSL